MRHEANRREWDYMDRIAEYKRVARDLADRGVTSARIVETGGGNEAILVLLDPTGRDETQNLLLVHEDRWVACFDSPSGSCDCYPIGDIVEWVVEFAHSTGLILP